VEDELLAPETAARDYGVVVRDGQVDEAATEALRRTLRAQHSPPSDFDFGPERVAYETLWPPEVQHALALELLHLPGPLRGHYRTRVWKQLTDTAARGARPLTPADVAATVQAIQAELSTVTVG
jgi:N-methylhydantoinase B